MVVTTQDRHPGQTLGQTGAMGLLVGESNVREYFPRGTQMIELELDHLRIACSLEESFWEGRPEIHDLRLSSWLESKRSSGKLKSHDAPVAMIPCGEFSFRLQMVTKDEADYSLAAPQPTTYFSPTVSPATLLNRRKHNLGNSVGQKPERREVGKLKNNERPTPAANH
jgi:hypothetical protein